MANAQGTTPAKPGGPAASGISGVLSVISKHLVPLLVSIVGAAALVAVIGGINMWSRFFVAQVPPEQAVDAIPDTELIVWGAVALVLLGAAGLLVMTAAYVLDRGGRQTKAVARSLVALAVLGGLITCLIAEEDGPKAFVAAAGLLAAGGLVGWGFFRWPWSMETDELELIEGEKRPGIRYPWMRESTSASKVPPLRFRLIPEGRWVTAAIAVLCAVGVWLLLDEVWLGGAIVLATLLVWGSYAVAYATGATFVWYGVSVFFCVLLFGAYLALVDIGIHQRVQPVAVIRNGDEPGQGVLGFYITENSERLYGATVAMGCGETDEIRKDSGRLFWIKKADIRAVSIGRLQDPEDVASAPAEMLRGLWAARLPIDKEEEEKEDKADGADERRREDDLLPPSPAVRYTPQVHDVNVAAASREKASSGYTVTVEGSDFGEAPVVTMDDVRYRDIRPDPTDDGKFTFDVPARAKGGRVEVECGEAAGPQEAVIEHGPIPVVHGWSARGRRLKVSARRSRDRDGEVVRYYWKLPGRDRTRDRITVSRPRPRGQPEEIFLTVTDDAGLKETVRVKVGVRRGAPYAKKK